MNAVLTVAGVFLVIIIVAALFAAITVSPWFMILAGCAFVLLGYGWICFSHH